MKNDLNTLFAMLSTQPEAELFTESELQHLVQQSAHFVDSLSAPTAPTPGILAAIGKLPLFSTGSAAILVCGMMLIQPWNSTRNTVSETIVNTLTKWTNAVGLTKDSLQTSQSLTAVPIIDLSDEELHAMGITVGDSGVSLYFADNMIDTSTMHPPIQEVIDTQRKLFAGLGYDTSTVKTIVVQRLNLSFVNVIDQLQRSQGNNPQNQVHDNPVGPNPVVDPIFSGVSASKAKKYLNANSDILFASSYLSLNDSTPRVSSGAYMMNSRFDWRAERAVQVEGILNFNELKKHSYDIATATTIPIVIEHPHYMMRAVPLRVKVRKDSKELVVIFSAVPTASLLKQLSADHQRRIMNFFGVHDNLSYTVETDFPMPGSAPSKILQGLEDHSDVDGTIELNPVELRNLGLSVSDKSVDFAILSEFNPLDKRKSSEFQRSYLQKDGFNVMKRVIYKSKYHAEFSDYSHITNAGVPPTEFAKEYDVSAPSTDDDYGETLPVMYWSKARVLVRGPLGIKEIGESIDMNYNPESPLLHYSIDVRYNSSKEIDSVMRRLVPVRIFFGSKDRNEPSLLLILWFKATDAFVAKLPERYRHSLSQELHLLNEVERGSISATEACNDMKGDASLLNICRDYSDVIRNLNVSPMPASDHVTIECTLTLAGQYELSLYSLNGEFVKTLIAKSYYSAGKLQQNIQLRDLHSGMYMIVMQGAGTRATARLIVE